MPTRLIREGIIDSRAVNALSEPAEILYRRLMSVVDDYGRFEADAELIRARCFPRQLDRWKVERVEKYLIECSTGIHGETPCVTVYSVGSRKYLQINNFGQRLQAKSKFPAPEDGTQRQPSDDVSPESTVDHGEKPSSRSRIRIRIRSRISNAESLGVSSPENGSAKTHGSRFSLETIPVEWIEWCTSDLGWSRETAQSVFLSFADYWKAKPGAGGRKADWLATWRNWCRREREPTASSKNGPTAVKPLKLWIDKYQECPHCGGLTTINDFTEEILNRGCAHYVSPNKFDATRTEAA